MKDPAFLFYSADFLIGTAHFSHEQCGQYIRILSLMHQKGRMRSHDIRMALACAPDDAVLEKFGFDGEKYYHDRLESEMEKRAAHAAKNRENARKRWDKYKKEQTSQPSKNDDATAHAVGMPLENENVNEIDNDNKGKGIAKGKGKRTNFKPPTMDQLLAYIIEREPDLSTLDTSQIAQRFMNHYESNGWMVGKNKMKNWMAAVRNWLSNRTKFEPKSQNHDNTKIGRFDREQLKNSGDYKGIG